MTRGAGCGTLAGTMTALLNTPLPLDYTDSSLFLRRWLLDLQLRVDSVPLERQKMLERKVYEFTAGKRARSHDKNGNATYHASRAYLLAKTATG